MDATLFDETHIAGLPLKNRLFRSATYLGMCNPDGTFGEGLLELYQELAEGGSAALFTELTDVCERDNALGDNMRLCSDDLIPEYARLAQIAHEHDARIFAQLNMNRYVSPDGLRTVTEIDQLTNEDLADIRSLFAAAAVRAQQCGFDGVQLHVAYGWLLNRFANPATNCRADEYGGAPENRVRLVCEIAEEIKRLVPDYPVSAKFSFYPRPEVAADGGSVFERSRSVDDMVRAYYALEEGAQQCALMHERGVDFIEVVGDHSVLERGTTFETCYRALAVAVMEQSDVPIILTGSNSSLDAMEEALEDFDIAYFGLSRSLIREPDLPNRWLGGDETGARCVHCDRCHKTPRKRCSYILRAQGEW